MVITSCGPSENDLKELDKYNNAVISYLDKYKPELYISEINYDLCGRNYDSCNQGELYYIGIKHSETKSLIGFERIIIIEFENLPGITLQSRPSYSARNRWGDGAPFSFNRRSPEDIYKDLKYRVDNDIDRLSGSPAYEE